MIYIKCFHELKSKMFFICSSLDEEDFSKLFDQLHDGGIKMKAVKKEEVSEIPTYLEEKTDCFYFPKNGYVPEDVNMMITEKIDELLDGQIL